MPAVHEMYPFFQNDLVTFNSGALKIAHALSKASIYGAAALYATQHDVTEIVAGVKSEDLTAMPRRYLQNSPMFGLRTVNGDAWRKVAQEMAHRDQKLERALELYNADIQMNNYMFLMLVRQIASHHLGFASVMFSSDIRNVQNLASASVSDVAWQAREIRVPLYCMCGNADMWRRFFHGTDDPLFIEINTDDSLFTAVQPLLHV